MGDEHFLMRLPGVKSLGKGPVKNRMRRKHKYVPSNVPIVTFRTTKEIKLLIEEGAKLQRRSMTKFLEQLVVDWHAGNSR